VIFIWMNPFWPIEAAIPPRGFRSIETEIMFTLERASEIFDSQT
jgi:hypothetical protein